MSVLYVTEQGASLRRRGQTICVVKERALLAEVEVHTLEAVLVFGVAQVSTQAMALLLRNGVETAFLTCDGRLRGQLTPARPKNVTLRIEQYRRSQDPAFCLTMARTVVLGKLENALGGIRRFQSNHPEADLANSVRSIESARDAAMRATDLDSLRGHEGAAAHAYFAAFRRMCLGSLEFPGRTRRPPRDPVNALLSLGYTLATNELQSLLDARGFDPYIGFLHEIHYGRPSLALDLLEEFRYPVVDRLTQYLANKGILNPEDFESDPEIGVKLRPAGLRRYLAAWEEWLRRPVLDEPTGDKVSYREIFRRQAERLAGAIRGGAAYRPHRFLP